MTAHSVPACNTFPHNYRCMNVILLSYVDSYKHFNVKPVGIVSIEERHRTCSSPRRTFFLHALSFQYTSKLCVTFLNLFLVYFIFKIFITQLSHSIVSCAIFFKNIVQLFINFTHSSVDIGLLTFCKNAKKLFYCSRELSLFWLNK